MRMLSLVTLASCTPSWTDPESKPLLSKHVPWSYGTFLWLSLGSLSLSLDPNPNHWAPALPQLECQPGGECIGFNTADTASCPKLEYPASGQSSRMTTAPQLSFKTSTWSLTLVTSSENLNRGTREVLWNLIDAILLFLNPVSPIARNLLIIFEKVLLSEITLQLSSDLGSEWDVWSWMH